ncbi:MAG TPA: hypothetical protein VHW05_13460 [Phenylobacterium sp.]|jgi:hypothetical protein|nr:hypothetical protein [Phenylobacterium sp.]
MTTTTTAAPLIGEAADDHLGRRYFKIPLSGRDGAGLHALLDLTGLRKLREAGARSLYLASDGQGRSYVTFLRWPSHRAMTAARAILGDPRGARIEYVSDDRLDLRSQNLRVRRYDGVGEARAAQVTA